MTLYPSYRTPDGRWHDRRDDQWPNAADPDRCRQCHHRASINRAMLCSVCDPADTGWPDSLDPADQSWPDSPTGPYRWLPEAHVYPSIVRETLARHRTLGLDGFMADGPYYMEWEQCGLARRALREYVAENSGLPGWVADRLTAEHPVIALIDHDAPTAWQLSVALTAEMGLRVPIGVTVLAALIAGYPVMHTESCTHIGTTLNAMRRSVAA